MDFHSGLRQFLRHFQANESATQDGNVFFLGNGIFEINAVLHRAQIIYPFQIHARQGQTDGGRASKTDENGNYVQDRIQIVRDYIAELNNIVLFCFRISYLRTFPASGFAPLQR